MDLVTKQLAVIYLSPIGSIKILGDFFRLTYVENTGAAFGQFQDKNIQLIMISLLCLGLVVFFYHNVKEILEKHSLILILTGAVGNLVDRIFRSHVIDFLDFDFIDIQFFHLERWPVFNLADSYIFIGVFLMVVSMYFTQPQKKH